MASSEEYELLSDSKYRSYISAIDKALKNFESTSEWADLISALGKLNKVLLNHIKQPVIPRRIIISKRLAQCMHPALPGGVHLKALETYDIIFRCIGTARLSQDLFIYSAGLFPLLAYAAMNVRQLLLKLYEAHFVPLEVKLRPGLPGFLTGVLPGLEEGAEYYDRTNTLLQKVCDGVGKEYFYFCLWQCVFANASVRLPAITYVYTHFNRKLSTEDQLYIMGTNVDVMVQALCLAVQDHSVLVQRSTLDFFLVAFPLHSTHLIRTDMERLLTSSVYVVLRRDMSLNRRLYSWLLGNDCNSNSTTVSVDEPSQPNRCSSVTSDSELNTYYFDTHSKSILVQALCSCLKNSDVVLGCNDHGSPQLRPYRLLISLLDKPEIGSAILDDILLEVFRALYWECSLPVDVSRSTTVDRSRTREDRGQGELLKTANLLFGTLEPHYIWEYLGSHFLKASECVSRYNDGFVPDTMTDKVQPVGASRPQIFELCVLTEFLLDFVSVETYIEMQTEHLPKLLRQLANILSSSCSLLSIPEVIQCLKLCSRLLGKIQPIIGLPQNTGTSCSSPNSDSGAPIKNSNSDIATTGSVDDSALGLDSSVSFHQKDTGFQTNDLLPDDLYIPNDISGRSQSPLPDKRRVSVSDCQGIKSHSLIRVCVIAFQECFVKLVTSHLFKPNLDSQGLLQRLLIMHQESAKERQYKLEQWLWKILQDCVSPTVSSVTVNDAIEVEHSSTQSIVNNCDLLLVENAAEFLEAFSLACQILVEFSSFPAFFVSGVQHINIPSSQNPEHSHIPEWLQLLLVISCFVRQMEFQLIAIGTILELMALTQSVASATSELSTPEKVHGTFSVLIDPLLEPTHLNFLHQQTLFCQVVARILWQYLDESHTNCLRKCVELLHQLHNLAPNGSVVEDVIGESMAEDDEKMQVKSVQKFAVLWHLTRGLPPRSSPTGKVRLLDRSLLVMLNCLLKPYGPQRAEVSSWLNHSLKRGDVGAVLEPILLILLHPDTARVSVQHVSIQSSQDHSECSRLENDTATEDDHHRKTEAKIYAISSVDGRVIYHVSRRSSLVPQTQNVMESPPYSPNCTSPRLFALASIAGGNTEHVVTSNALLRDFDLPSSCEHSLNEPISVFVNPLVSSGWVRTDSPESFCQSSSVESTPSSTTVTQAHRIDVSSLRNSYSFDDLDIGSMKSESNNTPSGTDPAVDLKSTEIVASILLEIVDAVVAESDLENNQEKKISNMEVDMRSFLSDAHSHWEGLKDVSIHPLHTYLLLYTQCYDSGRVLYALSTLKAILQANPRLAVCTMATTSIGNSRSPRQSHLYDLLARHRKAMFGKNFQGELSNEAITAFRSSMFLEIVISLCLYYTRSYYPNLAHMRLTEEDLVNNWEVQLLSVDVLTVLFAEVATVVRDSPKGFASYISNLLSKCKVQKTLLHCVLSGVFLLDRQQADCFPSKMQTETFTEAIIHFNERLQLNGDAKVCNGSEELLYWDYQETFQISMLRLLLVLIILEDQLAKHNPDSSLKMEQSATSSGIEKISKSIVMSAQQTTLRYQQGLLIPCQPIFQTAVLTALKQPYTSLLHRHWLGLISCALPFLRKALATLVVSTVSQLCKNLEDLATLYDTRVKPQSAKIPPLSQSKGRKVPVDHVILHLEGLTAICHYCLLDNSSLVSTVLAHASSTMTTKTLVSGANATQIISNLINVFAPSVIQKDSGDGKEVKSDPLIVARHNLVGKLPLLVSSLTTLWLSVGYSENLGPCQAAWVMGTPKIIQQLILELLSPISHHHGSNFLTTVAVVWNEKKRKCASRHMIPSWSEEQLVLVELVRSIKVMPMDTLVQLVRQILKQPPIISTKSKNKVMLEVTLLQYFYAYIQATPVSQMIKAWSSLQALIKDGLQIANFPAPALFMLLGILNEFVQRAPALEDRKEQKDLQDLTQKLVEACGNIGAASLEQTTWLRRNLAVKPGPQADIHDTESNFSDSDLCVPQDDTVHNNKSNSGAKLTPGLVSISANYSVQALSLLADLLASLLDVVYLSDEKEKAIPLLANLMNNVTPYLRNHCAHNVPSFRACSQLVASLSGYQYTRKAWRRDVFELLLEPQFFQMDAGCLRWWRTIIDNLMTHDKTTFGDLMARVSISQSGGLNLFSSKEQEYEQRAQLLKRLAFVIFCSEIDQYQSFMPEIQERLAESMRILQVPAVQAQVFLCFRVLLLRMSPQHITSLWPVIITEMVQVFLHIEQEVTRNTEEFSRFPSSHIKRLSALDSSWVLSSSNGLNANSHPAWLQLYLSVCKLLDLALCLPADKLPQFQMYSWAFVGESCQTFSDSKDERKICENGTKHHTPEFVPHIVRIAKKMTAKEPGTKLLYHPRRPLLTVHHINTLNDLQPFFETVATLHQAQHQSQSSSATEKTLPSSSQLQNFCDIDHDNSFIERLLERDFLEPLPSVPN